MRQIPVIWMCSLAPVHQLRTIGQGIVKSSTITSPITTVCLMTMVHPTNTAFPITVYRIIMVNLTTLVSSKTYLTMLSPTIPASPTHTATPHIMMDPNNPHPLPRILPMALSSPTVPMIRTT